MWRDKIQIYQKCGNRFQKPAKTNSVSVGTGSVLSTLVNFEHKITTSAMDGIGTGYTSHHKEICLHGKRLKNNFKINQSD